MISPQRIARFFRIEQVCVKYGLEELAIGQSRKKWIRWIFLLSPTRWLNTENRAKPRGERIRLALEELGPVFVKLGQILSTRRDLLPDDIGDELTRLQDMVPPFPIEEAKAEIEQALGSRIDQLFSEFTDVPLASASVAQVHAAKLIDGSDVVIKVLRPGIATIIDRDVSLMYMLADIMGMLWEDARRLRPREIVEEYDITIHDELDLIREASNATTLRANFEGSELLYIPTIHWEYTRKNLLVMERIYGLSIRDVEQMKSIGMDMKKLAEHGVEIFYTQVFKHNFFHADMHPGNIFVSSENTLHPQYIAVDFGIVGTLTDEDQHYLGENLLAFFRRDYRRVAQLHVDSGWVPANTRVADFETAIRTVCDPIFEKPLAEISFGLVLMQLFQTARRFQMEVQPQLVLLQKTLLNIEGLGRQLYPQLDLWTTAKPFLEDWVLERRGPVALLRKFVDNTPWVAQNLPELPLVMHDFVTSSTAQAKLAVRKESEQRASSYNYHKRLLVGLVLFLSSILLLSASMISKSDSTAVTVFIWLLGISGAWLSWSGYRSK